MDMADESWFKINKDYSAGQPERNAKRLQLLKQEEAAGLDVSKSIQHQEKNLTNFSAPKTVTKEVTVPKINYSPAMQEYFGTNVAPENSTSPEGEKLNKEMTVPTQEKPKGWLNDYLGGVVNRVIHPLEAAGKAAQEFMAMSPEDQAMSLIPAGIFIGKSSKLFSPMKQEAAVAMEKLGHSKYEIKEVLNLHRGTEGEWRSELSDINMKLTLPNPVTLSNGVTIREASLSSVVDHPELFKAYPGLAKNFEFSLVEGIKRGGSLHYPIFNNEGVIIKKGLITVTRPKEIIEGIYNPRAVLYGGELENIRRTVIHEIQHSIQKLEGWQEGANYNAIENKVKEKYKSEIEKLREQKDTGKIGYGQFINSIKQYSDEALDEYQRTAGEVEARLASMRATMTPKELKEIHPFDMGEIPLDKQILR